MASPCVDELLKPHLPSGGYQTTPLPRPHPKHANGDRCRLSLPEWLVAADQRLGFSVSSVFDAHSQLQLAVRLAALLFMPRRFSPSLSSWPKAPKLSVFCIEE